jgi:hypothetical protein
MRDFWGLYLLLGQHNKATGLLEQISAFCDEMGDWKGHRGASCASLARCYQAMGQCEKAITLSEQSAVIFEDL